MFGWSAVLPVLKFALPLPRLVRLMHAQCRREPIADRQEKIATFAAWAFKMRPERLRGNCLERALVTYRYLGRAGARPELVVGMSPGPEGGAGHVWVLVAGQPVHDSPERLARFAPIVSFGSDGERVNTGQPSPRGESGVEQPRTSSPPAASRRG
jgi:hypothetical protein